MSSIQDIALFYPKNEGDLRKNYPELSRIEEFKSGGLLSSKELLFVWYVANPTSKLVSEYKNMKQRISLAIKLVWPDEVDSEKFLKWREMMLPPHVVKAMARMEMFKGDVRYVAKSMVAKIFINLETLSNASEENFIKSESTGTVDGEGKEIVIKTIDWQGRKSYIDSCEKIMDMLPKTIQLMEEGFGVEVDSAETNGKGIDRFHKNKTE